MEMYNTASCRMMKLAGLIGLIGAAVVCQGQEKESGMKEAILLGDSIRIGYQTNVKNNLSGKATVSWPDENCQHSAFMLENLDKWLEGKTPDVVYFNCGLHDMFLVGNPLRCRRTPEAYAENLALIFEKLHTLCPDATLVFALTTPVDEEKQKTSKTYGRLVRRNSDVEKYNQVAVGVAEKHGVKIDNLHDVVQASGVDKMLVDDGIHLNREGAGIAGKHVAEAILKAMIE